jgi:hypothetical protein
MPTTFPRYIFVNPSAVIIVFGLDKRKSHSQARSLLLRDFSACAETKTSLLLLFLRRTGHLLEGIDFKKGIENHEIDDFG